MRHLQSVWIRIRGLLVGSYEAVIVNVVRDAKSLLTVNKQESVCRTRLRAAAGASDTAAIVTQADPCYLSTTALHTTSFYISSIFFPSCISYFSKDMCGFDVSLFPVRTMGSQKQP